PTFNESLKPGKLLRCSHDSASMTDRSNCLKRAQETLTSDAHFEQAAFLGWLYTSVIDRDFVDHELAPVKHGPTSEVTEPSLALGTERGSPRETLGPRELYAHLQNLRCDAGLAEDSVLDAAGSPLTAIGRTFAADALNVLVIGAGCAGLTLANALRRALGVRARIVVVENRIFKPNYKRPYARDWLTFIRLDVLEGLVDERVFEVLSRVGDKGYMGVPLNVFETLLLESCKELGVMFLFDQVEDYAPVLDAGVDVVIDATGNRLMAAEEEVESPGPTFKERNLERYGEGYGRFGITRTLTDRKAEVATIRKGNVLYPAIDGRRMKLACFKLTNVPIRLYQPLLDFVRGKNHDSRFYIWPGTLKPEINAMLLIINLHRPEYEALAIDIPEPVELSEFLGQSNAVDRLDRDVVELMKLIARKLNEEEDVRVEPPFIFAPYLKPYRPDERFHGKPLIRIGDSIFNGNPKTGNGLSHHLAHLRCVRDLLMECIQHPIDSSLRDEQSVAGGGFQLFVQQIANDSLDLGLLGHVYAPVLNDQFRVAHISDQGIQQCLVVVLSGQQRQNPPLKIARVDRLVPEIGDRPPHLRLPSGELTDFRVRAHFAGERVLPHRQIDVRGCVAV
ncbi:MAG: hypothetical protein ABI614_13010, partial [Planctomycetota bacterium]